MTANASTVGRRRLFRILVVLAAPLVVWLAGEAVLRIALFSPLIKRHPCSPGWNHPQYLVMPDPVTNYSLRPYFQGRLVNDFGDFDVPVVINSLGMRDRELQPAAVPGAFRILMLGDSNTFGEGVRYEDSYPAALEKLLDTGRRRVQVLDGGVPSDSLHQMKLRLQRLQGRVRPDLVTVCWVPSTFTRETTNRQYLNGYLADPTKFRFIHVVGDNLFLSNYPPESGRARADVWLQSHSFIYFFVKYRLWDRVFTIMPHHAVKEANNVADLALPPAYLVKPFEAITQMSDLCRSAGAPFVLIILGPNRGLTSQLQTLCREKNITVVMVKEGLYTNAELRTRLLFAHDWHLNAAGHLGVARELAPVIAPMITDAPAVPGGG
jgi:lysophospholipase L1-like esterase